jgi:phage host-nuclease inhibitor protein Gam
MIKKFLIAGTALAAIAAYSVASQPVEAGSCIVASAKARALSDAKATDKSMKHLKHVISHWAHKNKDKVVKVGKSHTTCAKKGPLSVCTTTAKVCG